MLLDSDHLGGHIRSVHKMKEKAYKEQYLVSLKEGGKENKDPRQHHHKKECGKRELEGMNNGSPREVKKFRSATEKEVMKGGSRKGGKAKTDLMQHHHREIMRRSVVEREDLQEVERKKGSKTNHNHKPHQKKQMSKKRRKEGLQGMRESLKGHKRKLLIRIPLSRIWEKVVKKLMREEHSREDERKLLITIPLTRIGDNFVKKISHAVEKKCVQEGRREKNEKAKKDTGGKELKVMREKWILGGGMGKKNVEEVKSVLQKRMAAACLPAEVWLNILSYLDEVSLLNFCQVAHGWSHFKDAEHTAMWRGRTLDLTTVSLQALARAQTEAYPSCLVLSHVPSKEALDVVNPCRMRSVEVNCGKLDLSVARHLVKLLRKAKQLKGLAVKGGGALRKLLWEFVGKVEEFSLTRTCLDRKDAIQLYDKLFKGMGGALQSLTLDLPLSFLAIDPLTAVLPTLRHVDLTNPEFTMEQALAVSHTWSTMEPALESLTLRGRLLAAHGGPADAKKQMPIGHLGQAEAPLIRAASRVASLTFHKCSGVGQLVPQMVQAVANSSSVRKLEIRSVQCMEEVLSKTFSMINYL